MVTKLSRKGQIVIPSQLRKKYNIGYGDQIELIDIGGEIVIIPFVAKNPIDDAKGFLKGGRTTRNIMQSIRKEESKLEKRKK